MLRIITERDDSGQWAAWYEDTPHVSWVDDSSTFAIARLIRCQRRPGLAGRIRYEQQDAERIVIVIIADTRCPDCGGTGQYVGLNSVEVCGACGGSGEV